MHVRFSYLRFWIVEIGLNGHDAMPVKKTSSKIVKIVGHENGNELS